MSEPLTLDWDPECVTLRVSVKWTGPHKEYSLVSDPLASEIGLRWSWIASASGLVEASLEEALISTKSVVSVIFGTE